MNIEEFHTCQNFGCSTLTSKFMKLQNGSKQWRCADHMNKRVKPTPPSKAMRQVTRPPQQGAKP